MRAFRSTEVRLPIENSALVGTLILLSDSSGEGESSLRCECVFGVHDAVAVALLGEEPLSVGCKVSVDCVTSNYGVEACGSPLRLRSQQPTKPLRLFLPGAEG